MNANEYLVSSINEANKSDSISRLRVNFFQARESISQNAWQDPIRSFIEDVRMVPDDTPIEYFNLIRGWGARLIEAAFLASEKYIPIKEFGECLREAVDFDNLPIPLSVIDNGIQNCKRLPSLSESTYATLSRYETLNALVSTLGSHVGGLMLSGSMGYGPFYNVRGVAGQKAGETWNSGIDLIACLKSNYFDNSLTEQVQRCKFLSNEDIENFIGRTMLFNNLKFEQRADILTHRFDIAGKDFNLGIHFFPSDTMQVLYGDQMKVALESGEDIVFTLKDYKPSRFRRDMCFEKGFDGTEVMYKVPQQETTSGGVLSELNGYIIKDDRYYPGLWQSMLLPEFKVLDGADLLTQSVVLDFKKTLINRLSREKSIRPASSLLKAHIRESVIAPERYNNQGIKI